MTIPAPYGTPDVWKSLIFRRQGFCHEISPALYAESETGKTIHAKTPDS